MLTLHNEPALLLFSGGQDSATCLGWALNHFIRVETVGFAYGQRHAVELECRRSLRESAPGINTAWRARLGGDTLLELDLFSQIGDTAMTSDMPIAVDDQGLPNTFVPGRNLLFLTAAAALAWRKGIRHIVIGVCEADSSGYPDCRDDAVKAMQVALNIGMNARFVIHAPLMRLDKADAWRLAEAEGGKAFVDLVRAQSHTCYLGERGQLHAWGYGCGECPACRLRAHGWEGYIAGAVSYTHLTLPTIGG